MTAAETAKKLVEKFGTSDVFALAQLSNVKIVYADWHPVTVGEYDKRAREIRVNRRALTSGKFSEREIVAHELGHHFAAEFNFDRATEEIFACDFAAELSRN
jgi:Zn-dependent membrane protease YugP